MVDEDEIVMVAKDDVTSEANASFICGVVEGTNIWTKCLQTNTLIIFFSSTKDSTEDHGQQNSEKTCLESKFF